MKPKDFTSHQHVAVPRGAKGGRIPKWCPHDFQGRYTVQPGDTMFFIAKRYGVSLDSLIAANPHIADPNLIFPGDVLCVPGPPVPKPPHKGRVPKRCPHGFQERYTVQPGDSMFSIAKKFKVSLDALVAANPHISDPALIFPGDVLCVPGPPVPKPPHKGRVPKRCPHGFQERYTVQPGDSMFSIAKKFRVSLDALVDANPHIYDPALIFPGDVLCVPGYTKPKPKPKPRPKTDREVGEQDDYGQDDYDHDDYEQDDDEGYDDYEDELGGEDEGVADYGEYEGGDLGEPGV